MLTKSQPINVENNIKINSLKIKFKRFKNFSLLNEEKRNEKNFTIWFNKNRKIVPIKKYNNNFKIVK